MNQEFWIYVTNLPNNTPQKDIIAYLSTAGPIKDWKFDKVDQRYSVHIIYYSIESAELAIKYLGTRQFQGRDLRIKYDTKKQDINHVMYAISQLNEEEKVSKIILQMKPSDKDELLLYLSNLYRKEDQMLLDFLETKPKILEALIREVPEQMHGHGQGGFEANPNDYHHQHGMLNSYYN